MKSAVADLANDCHRLQMRGRYEPESDFLRAIVAEEVPLSGSKWADKNLLKLIELMRDDDCSNRDWATFLLAQEETDSLSVRDALLHAAANDGDNVVRAEAVLGLAKRYVQLALPFVQKALQANAVTIPMLEAAAICAHPSLVPDLRIWAEPSDKPAADRAAVEALAACEQATPAS